MWKIKVILVNVVVAAFALPIDDVGVDQEIASFVDVKTSNFGHEEDYNDAFDYNKSIGHNDASEQDNIVQSTPIDKIDNTLHIDNIVDVKIKIYDNEDDTIQDVAKDITTVESDNENSSIQVGDDIVNTIQDHTLEVEDIIDVIENYIGERDPILQLYLHICFLQPTCYQMNSTSSHTNPYTSPLAQTIKDNLLSRRTETARDLVVGLIRQVQEKVKILMFKYIEEGVGKKGVSIMATKAIIDSLKDIWMSISEDLEYAKSNVEELFYILPMDTRDQVQAVVEMVEIIQKIPSKTDILLQKALKKGYMRYIKRSSRAK